MSVTGVLGCLCVMVIGKRKGSCRGCEVLISGLTSNCAGCGFLTMELIGDCVAPLTRIGRSPGRNFRFATPSDTARFFNGPRLWRLLPLASSLRAEDTRASRENCAT